MPADRVEGLEVVDCTDVLIANTDLPVPVHVPTVVEPNQAPLPGHEHQMNHAGEGPAP